MVSLDKLHLLSNLKLTALMHIVYSCMIIMVLCESDSDWDEKDFTQEHFSQINQSEQNKVIDSKKITTIEDLKEKIVLDERSVLYFPVQEDGYVKRINIPARISHNHCRKFGILLLGLDRMLDIKVPVEESQDLSCETILLKWLKMGGTNYDEPITFRTLINVIYKLGEEVKNDYNELANKIKITVDYYNTIDTDYIPVLVRKYSTKLSERYQKESVVDNFQWIPKMLDREIEFVDLELKQENNDNLTLDDVLYDIQGGTRVLFTGRPGVGKTTITRYLSKHIHEFKSFTLVIKLHLGALSDPIDNLSSLLEVHGKSFLSFDIASISDFIQRTNGKNICFLFDGYDEYILSRHGNYIKRIILSDELTDSVVIVTSRPNAVKEIKNLFKRKGEIIGFAENKINTYVRQLQLSNTQNETIYQYLDNHPNIRQMCYLPLHLSMLVYMIIASDGDSLALVNTETELYYNFLALTIKHYENVRHQRAVESLKECFSNSDTQTDLCDILRSISEIAFNGIRNRTQMFTSSSLIRLSRIANISAEIEALSLFKIEPAYNKDGTEFFKYSYSHPTFQEFLAAFHLTTLPKKFQLDYLNHKNYWWMREVCKYYFGLIRSMSKYDNEAIMTIFLTFVQQYRISHNVKFNYAKFYLMKLAHEAGHDLRYIYYLRAAGIISQNNSVHVYFNEHDSYHCWYLGYIIVLTPLHELWLHIDKTRLHSSCISSVVNYLKNDARFSGDANVTKLVIKEELSSLVGRFMDIINTIHLQDVIKIFPIFQRNLHCLELFCHIDALSFVQLGENFKSFSALQSLALQVDISIIKGNYFKSLLQDLTHLRHLELTLLNSHGDSIADNLLEFRSLKQLQSLKVDFLNLGHLNVTALLGGLKYLTNLEILFIRLHSYQFGNDDTKELLGIEEIHSIKNLSLDLYICTHDYSNSKYVDIKKVTKVLNNFRLLLVNLSLSFGFESVPMWDHVSMIELADGLKNLTELQELSLHLKWKILINDSTSVALDKFKQLHTQKLVLKYSRSCNELLSLSLSSIQLQNLLFKCEGVFKNMKKMLNQLTSLKELILSENLIEDNEVKLLIEVLKEMSDLRILDLSNNFIGDDDMKQLTEVLKKIDNLDTLDLSDNFIGNDGIKTFIEVLKKMDNLQTLDLSNNVIGDDGIKLLADLLDYPQEHLCNLKVLILKYNTFGEVGARILADKFKKLQIEFDFDTAYLDPEAQSQIQLQKLMKEFVNLPLQTFTDSEEQSHLYRYFYYYAFSFVLGLVMIALLFNLKSRKATKNFGAHDSNTYLVLAGGNLPKPDDLTSYGTGTVIVIYIDSLFYGKYDVNNN